MISDLLDFSKAESGQLTLVQTPFRAEKIISRALRLFEHRAAKTRVQILRGAGLRFPEESRCFCSFFLLLMGFFLFCDVPPPLSCRMALPAHERTSAVLEDVADFAGSVLLGDGARRQ